MGDEASGPIANLLPVPQDGGDGEDGDPLAELKADIRTARGRALLVETSAAGWGEGRGSAPQRDWMASRLGANPPEALVNLRGAVFNSQLAMAGVPPSLFVDADGTAQREALRRHHQNVTLSYARILADELTVKMETPIELVFDNYPLDIQARATAFAKFVSAGATVEQAMQLVSLGD